MNEMVEMVNEIIRECRKHKYCEEGAYVCPYWNGESCLFTTEDSEVGQAPEFWNS